VEAQKKNASASRYRKIERYVPYKLGSVFTDPRRQDRVMVEKKKSEKGLRCHLVQVGVLEKNWSAEVGRKDRSSMSDKGGGDARGRSLRRGPEKRKMKVIYSRKAHPEMRGKDPRRRKGEGGTTHN